MDQLRLMPPVSPWRITQGFGDDLVCIDGATRTRCVSRTAGEPCPHGFISLYTAAGMRGHNGLDLYATHGQDVYAAHEGMVTEIVDEPARGKGVGIVSTRKYEFEGKSCLIKIRYWHLQECLVGIGDRVDVGDVIGRADNTGFSAGDHLHLELKPVRRRFGRYRNVFPANGFKGALNPLPYFPAS